MPRVFVSTCDLVLAFVFTFLQKYDYIMNIIIIKVLSHLCAKMLLQDVAK